MKDYDIAHSCDDLKKLIAENPDLPLVFDANEDANTDGYETMICTVVYARIGEVLDCDQDINNERIYTDRAEFKDAVEEYLYDTDGNYEQELERILAQYEPSWKKCILVTVGN